METVLKRLEERIDALVTAHQAAGARVRELEAKVVELEQAASAGARAAESVTKLEGQRDELLARLEKVLSLVDGALAQQE